MDSQHKQVIGIINVLHDVIKKADKSLIDNVIESINKYINEHFAFEESLMEAANYPQLKMHKNLHKRFSERVEKYTIRWRDEEDIAQELYDFMDVWLRNHIRFVDADYIESVNKKCELLEQ